MVLIDRATVVRIHLDRLAAIIAAPEPGLAEAIYASIALRFLFDDNLLGQVARDFDIPLIIEAPDLSGVPIDAALFFACGGYVIGSDIVRPFYTYREPGPNSPYRRQFEMQVAASPSALPTCQVKFSKYRGLPCLALVGTVLSREQVVRYVANKCGGAHHHDNIEDFNKIERSLTQVGQVLTLKKNSLSAVFIETIGTAWFLLQSQSVRTLRSSLASSTSRRGTALQSDES
ncbi:hypothetical protein HUW63_26080 [Myxococcus sp. AM001]|nr:hypothetical protein [Myxococcus sp. AM001]